MYDDAKKWIVCCVRMSVSVYDSAVRFAKECFSVYDKAHFGVQYGLFQGVIKAISENDKGCLRVRNAFSDTFKQALSQEQ